jgi:hypothetical protein
MKTHIPILSLSLIALLALGSCKKEKPCKDPSNPECENYDPCYGKKAPSADFKLGVTSNSVISYLGQTNFILYDTLFRNSRIEFIANEPNAKYTWKLGAETIEQKSFMRSFINTPYGHFTATLTIEKEVDNTCFPDYTGTATITKKFETRPQYLLPIMGKYRVLFEGNKDSSIVEIRPYETVGDYPGPYIVTDSFSLHHVSFLGFTNTGDRRDSLNKAEIHQSYLVTGNNIVFADIGYGYLKGYVKLLEGKYIEAKYFYSRGGGEPEFPKQFKGIKIE